jgi:hypothetical protein
MEDFIQKDQHRPPIHSFLGIKLEAFSGGGLAQNRLRLE